MTTHPTGRPARTEVYRKRLARFRSERDEAEARSRATGRLRMLVFLLFVVAFLVAERTAGPVAAAAAAGGLLSGAYFLVLVGRHRRIRRGLEHTGALVRLNEEALARCERRWEGLPAVEPPADLEDHPYAGDLDVVGPASLERLLNTVSTGPGGRMLRSWLLEGAGASEVRTRQEAISELGGDVHFRQELAARCRTAGLHRSDRSEALVAWAEEPSWLEGRRWLVWVARLVPLLTVALLAARLGGGVDGAWWIVGPLLGLVYLGLATEPIGAIFDRISEGQRSVGAYGGALELLEGMSFGSPRLRSLHDRVREGEGSAARALERLEWWLTVADVRLNHLIHVPLQVFFFWDVHILEALEDWRLRNGRSVGRWLQALGEVEALAALSALASDHDDWHRPDLVAEPRLEAEALGHPLIRPDTCVRNDVELGPPGTFLFLTGSNMSGKSTFLRSIGINVVLARAGAPVCARAFRTAEFDVATSMRTEDSLARGVSAFMAELQRVAKVVELARAAGPAGDFARTAPVLYLLDEPLQGTNEAERRIALRIVLDHLLECHAVGSVATHDLLLHRTERLEAVARPVHFESRVEEADGRLRLTFDHRLREGPATSTNALDLLRLAGLGKESAEEPEPADRGERRAR